MAKHGRDMGRKARKRLTALGCEIEQTRGGHVKITCPNGEIVIHAWSSSDHRAVKNLAAQLRRIGEIDIHWKELL